VATGNKKSDRIRRVARSFTIILGAVLIAPGAILLSSHLFFYTVGLKPSWLPWLLAGMAALGAFLIFGGASIMKRRVAGEINGQ
jgi:hypothetical protein